MGLGKQRRMKLVANQREAESVKKHADETLEAARRESATVKREAEAAIERAEAKVRDYEADADKLRRRLRTKSEELDAVRTSTRKLGATLTAIQKLSRETREVWREAVSAHADRVMPVFVEELTKLGVEGEQARGVLNAALQTFFGTADAAFEIEAAKRIITENEAAEATVAADTVATE